MTFNMKLGELGDGQPVNTIGARLRDAVEPILSAHLSEIIDELLQIRLVRPGGGVSTRTNPWVSSSAGIEYLHGLDSINQAITVSVASARQEILTAQPDGPRPEAVLATALANVRGRLLAGVGMRTLYQHSTRFDEPTKEYARSVIELGGELRTLDEFFERLIIIDRDTAFIPTVADRTTAAKVTEPAIVGFLVDLFDRTWDRAAPFPYRPNRAKEAAPEIMPEIRQAIKNLLIEGHTDKMIARRLGISERTLSAHVAWLRTSLGASNRLQLGYKLAEERFGVASTGNVESPSTVAAEGAPLRLVVDPKVAETR